MAITLLGVGAVTVVTAAPLTPAIPAVSYAADDLLLSFTIAQGTRTITEDTGAGWTARFDHTFAQGGANHMGLGYKFAASGSEADPTLAISAYGSGVGSFIAIFRGVDKTTPFDVADVFTDIASASTWTPTGLTTATDGAWVLSFVRSDDDNALGLDAGNEQGFTLQAGGADYDWITAVDAATGLATKAVATAGAVTMPTWIENSVGPDAAAAVSIALRPASGGTTPVAQTRQLIYGVAAGVSDALQMVYGTRASVSDSLQVVHGVLTSVADAIQLVHGVRATAADTLQIIYDVLALAGTSPVSDTLTINYNTLWAVADTLGLPYNTRTTVSDTLGLPYDTLTSVSDTVALVWATLTRAADALHLEWNVFQTILLDSIPAALRKRAQFRRSPSGSLILVPLKLRRAFQPSEGWEIVSSTFYFNHDQTDATQRTVGSAWSTYRTADAAVLLAAIDAALTAAGAVFE